ncbi:MAG: HEAT repeat domain-containing protein [Deltaproteobacteria bacterium]|nr:HEAT repeat domain-containing protein [Deltaproteobacteria bacterium]
MLDGLDSIDWSSLEDAYGPAVDVPDLLRAIAGGEPRAVGTLEAHIFHQGATYYPAAPPAVPFLIELATTASVEGREVVIDFLAELCGPEPVGLIGWDPYAFRSTPASPEQPEGKRTVAAIRRGVASLRVLVSDGDPRVRASAARLVAELRDSESLDELRSPESDPRALTSRVLARARLGEDADALRELAAHEHPAVRAAVAVGLRWCGDETSLAMLEEASLLPGDERFVWDFPWGDLVELVASVLIGALEGANDEVVEQTLRVVRARLARGDSLSPPRDFPRRTLDPDPPKEPWRESAEDRALRALVGVVARGTFANLAARVDPIEAHELSDAQRSVLQLTVDFGMPIPVRAIPWLEPDAMRRYLEGGGPLDRPVTIDGKTRPAWLWLDETKAPELDAVDAVLATIPDDELIPFVEDLLSFAYSRNGSIPVLKWNCWDPLSRRMIAAAPALAEPIRALAANLPEMVPSQVALLFARLIDQLGELDDERWDHLLRRAAYVPDDARPLLEPLPLERRSRIVGGLQNPYTRGKMLDLGDPAIVRATTLELMMTKDWWADVLTTEQILTALGEEAVPALRDTLTKAIAAEDDIRTGVIEKAIRALEGTLEHELVVVLAGDEIDAALFGEGDDPIALFTFPANPKEEDLATLAAALEAAEAIVLRLTDDDESPVGNNTLYRLQRLIHWEGAESIHWGGTSLRRG